MSKKAKKKNHKKHSSSQLTEKKNFHLEGIHEIFSHKDRADESSSELKDDTNIIADIINEERDKRKWRIILFASIFLSICAIAAIAGLLYFNAYNPFAEENIILNIDGPDKTKVGEEITYTIDYQNTGEVSIHNTKLIINEPHGFNLISSIPEISGHSFDLGTIEAREKGSVEITGEFLDNLETTQVLSTTIIFMPNNFNSEFSITSKFYTVLEPLPITIQPNAPPTTTVDQDTSLEFAITNNGLKPYKNFRLLLNFPPNFTVGHSSTDYFTDDNQIYWEIENIEPDQEIIIDLIGRFNSNFDYFIDQNQEQSFKISTALVNTDNENIIQEEQEFTINITAEPINLSLIANGQNITGTIDFEDNVNISISFDNKSEDTINNLSLDLIIASQPIEILDWNNLDDDYFGQLEKTDAGTKLTWNFNNVEVLESLRSDEKDNINIIIPILPLDDINYNQISSLENVTLHAFANLYYNDNPDPIKSNSVELNVNSNVQLDIEAKYYNSDGSAIGQGPIPPLAEETTSYYLTFNLSNELHELKDITIKSTLPPKVFWTDDYDVSVGQVKYTPGDRTITWSINRLPVSAKSANLTLKLDLKPSNNDVGKLMKLLEYSNLSVTDIITNDTISQTYGIITTNLESDRFGIGKGIIQESFSPFQ